MQHNLGLVRKPDVVDKQAINQAAATPAIGNGKEVRGGGIAF